MTKYKFDIANEQVLLAAMLIDGLSRQRILGSVDASYWQGPRHRAIFESISTCTLKGVEVTKNNIAVHAKEDFGGIEYLDQLYGMELSNDVEYHVSRLRQEAARLDGIDKLKGIEKQLSDRETEFLECIQSVSQLRQAMVDAAQGSVGGMSQKVGEKWLDDFDERCQGKKSFVSTGFDSLDSVLTDGFHRGGVSVIAGRPRSGKSTLIVDMIRRILADQSRQERVGMFPLEGGSQRFLDMLVASITGIDTERMVKHPDSLSLQQRKDIRMAVREYVEEGKKISEKILAANRLVVIDNPFISLAEQGVWSNEAAMNRMEQLLAEGGYDIAVFDLWERCLTDLSPQKIAGSLVRMQILAQKYQTHCIIVQQLRRDVEDRTFNKSRRPSLIDLKNSGAYEEISDLVLLIHREKVFKPFIKDDIVEVTVSKQKRGQDSVTMIAKFQPEVCRLNNDKIDDDAEGDESVSLIDA